VRDAAASLIAAMEKIPRNLKVGAVIASEPIAQVDLAPWSDRQKEDIVKLVRSASFVGGQDNTPALVEALKRLESEPDAALVWIHGPQPVRFSGTAGHLEQATARLTRLPNVWLYGIEPGPNELLPDAPWAWGAHALPHTGKVDADVAAFFEKNLVANSNLSIHRVFDPAIVGPVSGSDHIARLWANERVASLMRTDATGNRKTATELATRYQLVTPVSGAVVLETNAQYEENRLTPADHGAVPTIPEPEEWVLIILSFLALIWLLRRRTPRIAVA